MFRRWIITIHRGTFVFRIPIIHAAIIAGGVALAMIFTFVKMLVNG